MKKLQALVCLAIPLIIPAALIAGDAKSEVDSAIKNLSAKGSYSWKSTVTVPEGSRMRMGPTEGSTQKDGLTRIAWTMGDTKTEAVMKGENSVMLGQDGTWQKPSEAGDSQGQGRGGRGMFLRNFRAPATQAAEILGFVKELKKDGDAYAGDLSEEGVKQLITFRRGSGDAPSVSNGKGSAKFWIKDGVLSKYETQVEGNVSFNGNDREVKRTTTVELKDIGSTKVEVPEEALKKLS